MKTIIIRKIALLSFLLWSLTPGILYSQYILKGKILDQDGIQVPFATVGLKKDSVFTNGTTADSTGYLVLNDIKSGNYKLNVSCMGYESLLIPVTVNNDLELKEIIIKSSAINLDDVTITAIMPKILRRDDRFIVQMQNSAIVQGKNAISALRYAPGIMIETDGSIVLNGKKGITLMINGKKLNMPEDAATTYLSNIRAENIEKVEVITNPGARFESEGQGGIIDIYLKKTAEEGLNGSVYTTLTQAYYLGYNLGSSLNFKYKKLTLSAMIGYGKNKDFSSDKEELIYINTNDKQYNDRHIIRKQNTYMYRTGLQYDISKYHVMGLEFYGMSSGDSFTIPSKVKVQSASGIDSTVIMNADGDGKYKTNTLSFNYIYTPSKTQSVNLLSDYSVISQNIEPLYNFSSDRSPGRNFIKKSDSKTSFYILSTQLDYKNEFDGNKTLSAGTKFSSIKTDVNELLMDFVNSSWINIPKFTNKYLTNEYLTAIYADFSGKSKRFNWSVGIRGEHNVRDFLGSILKEFQVFPSVLLKYSPSGKWYYTVSYRRRINRAPYRSLIPFYSYSTPFNVTIGTPGLKSSPVQTLSFVTGYKSYSLSTTYDYIKNMIYPISSYESETGINYRQNANTRSGHMLNINLTLPFTITKWWSNQNSVAYQYRRFYDEKYIIDSKNSNMRFSSLNSFSLPYQCNFDFNFTISTPSMAGPMIDQYGGVMMDAGLSKMFFKNKLGVSINATDITGLFSNFRQTSNYNGFTSELYSNLNQRNISISLKYNFKTGKDFNARTNKSSQNDEKTRTSGL